MSPRQPVLAEEGGRAEALRRRSGAPGGPGRRRSGPGAPHRRHGPRRPWRWGRPLAPAAARRPRRQSPGLLAPAPPGAQHESGSRGLLHYLAPAAGRPACGLLPGPAAPGVCGLRATAGMGEGAVDGRGYPVALWVLHIPSCSGILNSLKRLCLDQTARNLLRV